MEFLFAFLLGLGVGYISGVVKTIGHLKHLLNKQETLESNLEKHSIPVLMTEKHGDTLYLFEKETDHFMCQGSSLEDLAKKLSEYKDIHIALVDHNSKPVWFVNGEISEEGYES